MINMEPENTPLEEEKIIFQTIIIFRFYVNFWGVLGWDLALASNSQEQP